MVGAIVGAVVVFGLIGVARRIRRRRMGMRGGFGRWHGHARDGGGGYSRRSWWLRGIFTKLDTTPGQEKAIRAALEELREIMKAAREEAKAARGELAQAIRGDVLDEGAFVTADVRIARVTDSMRRAVRDVIAKTHDALDPRQRATLADLLESGGGWRGPYRGAATL
jgi:uncharacterized membrane protein